MKDEKKRPIILPPSSFPSGVAVIVVKQGPEQPERMKDEE